MVLPLLYETDTCEPFIHEFVIDPTMDMHETQEPFDLKGKSVILVVWASSLVCNNTNVVTKLFPVNWGHHCLKTWLGKVSTKSPN